VGERRILRRPPRADRAKCGVSPHLPQMIAGTRCLGPSVAPPVGAGYREKTGPGAILFPSSLGLCVLLYAELVAFGIGHDGPVLPTLVGHTDVGRAQSDQTLCFRIDASAPLFLAHAPNVRHIEV